MVAILHAKNHLPRWTRKIKQFRAVDFPELLNCLVFIFIFIFI